MSTRLDQDLLLGLVPLHVLHHAGEGPVYGMWIIEELGRHGYKLSAGTLYPLLHRLERSGLLVSQSERSGRRTRRLYKLTPTGRRSLKSAKQKVRELFAELFESELHGMFGHGDHDRQRLPPDERVTAPRSSGNGKRSTGRTAKKKRVKGGSK